MADNLVRLMVGANDADAIAHLEALQERLNKLGRSVETASVKIDDGPAFLALGRIAARMDAVQRRIDRLKASSADPSVKLEGIAKAELELRALNIQMDKLKEKNASGLFSNLGGLIGNLAGKLGTAVQPAAAFAGKWALIGSAAVAAGAPLAAIGAALGSFGLFAVPELTKVEAALGKTGAAGKKAWAQLTPGERDVGRSMKQLEMTFHDVQKALQPVIDKTIRLGVGVLQDLMPALETLARAGAKVLSAFMRPFDKMLRSPAFGQFVNEMAKFAVQAARAFAPALVKIMEQVLKLIVALAPAGIKLDISLLKIATALVPLISLFTRLAVPVIQGLVVPAINAIVSQINAALKVVAFLESHWSSAWASIVGALRSAWSFISGIFHDIEGAISSVSGMVSGLAGAFGGLSGAISSVGGFLGHFGLAAGGIVGAASGGPRSGLTLVGERGPELLRLPPGTQVYNNGQTQQMLGGGGPVSVALHITSDGGGHAEYLRHELRKHIRVRYGGSVTAALGS